MGLIAFAKSAGRKAGLFGGQQAAEAERIAMAAREAAIAAVNEAEQQELETKAVVADLEAALMSHGLQIDELQINFDTDTDTAAVTGTAETQTLKEKAILVIGNTEGVAAVDDGLEVEISEPPAVYHTVVSGDSLSAISKHYYGSFGPYETIFVANQPMLEHPDKIYPQQVLRIPATAKHVVQPGETLGGIAKHWYGKAGRYTDIFEANTDILESPDAIEVGQELTIALLD